MFKYLTQVDGKSVAVNPLHVMSITEFQLAKSYPKQTVLALTNGERITVTDNYLEVVAALSI